MNRVYFKNRFYLLVMLFTAACSGNKENIKQETQSTIVSEPISIGKETSMLLKDLENKGDYVNSQDFPSLIKSSIVNESLGKNILVIDMRSPENFSNGHIKGAVNVQFSDLPDHFESVIRPFEYDKIILVCEDGHVSSYSAALLRLMGYGNVYAMRWGMSAWNIQSANVGWLKGISSKYETSLEQTEINKPPAKSMPELKTGQTTTEGIFTSRFKRLFEENSENAMISADEVFKDPHKYFIINYERKDKYDAGHIPGTVRYKPDGTLGIVSEMSTIPTDKVVVVYCGSGHNSCFVTAYLRLFGYDAKALKYGNNGFMYDRMVSEKNSLSWLPFSNTEINDFVTEK